ncbi:MAG: SprT family zinc-dependent metalloprotease [Vicinamibacterales bacterium]
MKASSSARPPYDVIRSRRATADIIIERDGSLLVRAPEWVDDEQVEAIVDSRLHWIYRGLAEWRDLNATRVLREYKSGEGFLYLGRAYRLILVQQQDEPLVLKDGRFRLRRDLVEAGDIGPAQAAFRDYFIARGRNRIGRRVEYFASTIGVTVSGMEVRDTGHQWATWSPSGRLAFHWKCMMAPATVIDYIVVHELCHFHHADHTDAFWNEVDKVMPQYRERKEWLRRNGAALDV